MIHTNEGNKMVMKKPEEPKFNKGLYVDQVLDWSSGEIVDYRPELIPEIWGSYEEYRASREWYWKQQQKALADIMNKPDLLEPFKELHKEGFIDISDILKDEEFKLEDDTNSNK